MAQERSDFRISRDHILETLQTALAGQKRVRALHLGGSFASDRTDDASDIDLCATVEDDSIEETFATVERTLRSIAPIRHSFRMPEPTWHGHSQCFYALEDADPRHMIDLVVMKASATDRLLEVERHGNAVILFDHDGFIEPTHIDRNALRDRMAAMLESTESRFMLFESLVTKALDRGFVAEAIHFYTGLVWRPLVDLYRIAHCPDRFDFGARYLDRDVPPDVRATIERLALAGSADQLRSHHAEILGLFPEALRLANQRVATYLTESPD